MANWGSIQYERDLLQKVLMFFQILFSFFKYYLRLVIELSDHLEWIWIFRPFAKLLDPCFPETSFIRLMAGSEVSWCDLLETLQACTNLIGKEPMYNLNFGPLSPVFWNWARSRMGMKSLETMRLTMKWLCQLLVRLQRCIKSKFVNWCSQLCILKASSQHQWHFHNRIENIIHIENVERFGAWIYR